MKFSKFLCVFSKPCEFWCLTDSDLTESEWHGLKAAAGSLLHCACMLFLYCWQNVGCVLWDLRCEFSGPS